MSLEAYKETHTILLFVIKSAQTMFLMDGGWASVLFFLIIFPYGSHCIEYLYPLTIPAFS